MGIDQGTTGTTVLILDEEWNQLSRGYKEHTQIYPKPGWVEHDPLEIWGKIREAAKDAADQAEIKKWNEIACIGLDNQGETVVLWDKETESRSTTQSSGRTEEPQKKRMPLRKNTER